VAAGITHGVFLASPSLQTGAPLWLKVVVIVMGLLIVAVVVGSFALLTVAQGLLPAQADGPRWRAWHAHLLNGLYLNTLANRAVLRLWPRPSSPHPRPGTRA